MRHTLTPERITRLAPNEAFASGSNAKGRNLGDAARTAWLEVGSKFGRGIDHHGQSYAIGFMSELPTLEHQV